MIINKLLNKCCCLDSKNSIKRLLTFSSNKKFFSPGNAPLFSLTKSPIFCIKIFAFLRSKYNFTNKSPTFSAYEPVYFCINGKSAKISLIEGALYAFLIL